jgi:hypothetical protein
MGGSAATRTTDTNFYQRTERCPGGAADPQACCSCPADRYYSGFGTSTTTATTLGSASWGGCCSCRVEVRINSVNHPGISGNIVPHAQIFMKCSDGRRWVISHAASDGHKVTNHVTEFYPDPVNRPKAKPETIEAGWQRELSEYPTVNTSRSLSCNGAEQLVALANSKNGETYGTVVHCRYCTTNLIDAATDFEQADEPCPSIP